LDWFFHNSAEETAWLHNVWGSDSNWSVWRVQLAEGGKMGIHGASSGHSLSPLLRNVAAISRAKSPLCRHCPINIIAAFIPDTGRDCGHGYGQTHGHGCRNGLRRSGASTRHHHNHRHQPPSPE